MYTSKNNRETGTLLRALALSVLLSASAAHAQMGQQAPMPKLTEPAEKEPTLEQTQAWLVKTNKDLGIVSITYVADDGVVSSTVHRRRQFYFSGCVLSLLSMDGGPPGSHKDVDFWWQSVSLTNLDPNEPFETLGKAEKIRTYMGDDRSSHGYTPYTNAAYYIGDIEEMEKAKQHVLKLYKAQNRQPAWRSELELDHYPRDIKKRIRNAMSHAIKLCVKQAAQEREAANAAPVKPAGELF